MAYLSLYRKYRPQTFDEILGQEHVSTTLANAIREDRVAHAYLFTGPRGTGKTSTARILAKALNCETGPTPSPCGKCASCVAIADGSSLDVIEMDAASHSKVDETRDILAGVPLATVGGRKKVYVIDEVHMLSAGSFNALLKTLEEPPSHVVFILATTEAHKVLQTIVSRTQRFDFRRVPLEVLEHHLDQVAKGEGIDIDPAAVTVLARHAEGSVRDALSALDQLSSFGGPVTAADAERLLGRRSEDVFVDLFDAIAAGDVGAVFATTQTFVSQGADLRQFAFDALEHCRSLLLLKTAPEGEELLDMPVDDRPRLVAQADAFAGGTLLRILDLLGKAIIEMRNAPNHRLLLEVALVRAAAPDTDPSPTGLLGRIERLERRMGILGTEEAAAPPPAAVAPAPDAEAPAEAPSAAPRRAAARPRPAERSQPAPASAPAPAAAGVPAEIGLAHVRESWAATRDEVNKRSRKVGAYLNPSRPVALEGEQLVVEVQSEWHRDAMADERSRQVLADALHAVLGVRPALSFVARQNEPAKAEPADDIAEYAEARPVDAKEHDPVELVKRGLSAEVVEEIVDR